MSKFYYSKLKLLIQTNGINIKNIESLYSTLDIVHIDTNKITINIESPYGQIAVYTFLDSTSGIPFENITRNIFFNKKLGIKISIPLKPHIYDYEIGNKNLDEIINIETSYHLPLTASNYCYYFKNNNECKFCAINTWRDSKSKSINKKIEAIKLATNEDSIKHISITTGTLNTADRGLKIILKFVEKIRKEGIHLLIAIECEPTSKTEYLKRLKDMNVTTISCNIEFLDDNIRKQLMPGKGSILFEEYLFFFNECVNIFDNSQIYTNVLWSKFDLFNENVKNRIKLLTKLGVIPSIGVLYSEEHSQLGMVLKPNIDTMYDLHLFNAFELKKNGLNPLKAIAGCPKNSSYSAINEFYKEI